MASASVAAEGDADKCCANTSVFALDSSGAVSLEAAALASDAAEDCLAIPAEVATGSRAERQACSHRAVRLTEVAQRLRPAVDGTSSAMAVYMSGRRAATMSLNIPGVTCTHDHTATVK